MPRPAPFDSLCLISCVESRGFAFEMPRQLPQEMQFWLVFVILKSCLIWGWSRDFVKWILSLGLISFEFRLISRVLRSYFWTYNPINSALVVVIPMTRYSHV